MTDKKLISIIIPSRNRQKYAIHCIKSILAIDNHKLEVVVHDNSDTDELKQWIEKDIIDNRLIYRYDPTPMSTIHNFNKAMELVNAEYICFIGDDDGVTPEIVEAAEWAKVNNIDAIVEKTRIDYIWPNVNRTGEQSIYPFSGSIKSVDVNTELMKFLKDGGIYYLKYDLPKVYHGVVKKESFDKIKNITGSYFGGLSADIYASICLSLVVQKAIVIDYPLTIAGSSLESQQTHQTERAKKLPLQNAPHFRARGNYVWSDRVPFVYSGATIWAESSIKALEAFGRIDLINKVDKFKLAAHIILKSPHYEKTILNNFVNHEDKFKVKFKFYRVKISTQVKSIIQKIGNRIKRKLNGKAIIKYNNVLTIREAVDYSKNYMKSNDISLNKILSKVSNSN
ncbi:glycosyltransferase family 2 protein [Sunxiuqinia sp. sy24]|uniref:glycosyltransferase family 2 protein n=1 Tax=Sunxiuqinia sp. sy24 TaxID=3461495 RepID=UPI0040455197